MAKDIWGNEIEEDGVKRNIYTMVIDHDNNEATEDEVVEALDKIDDILRSLYSDTDGVRRADVDIDQWETVTDEYDD